MDMHVYCADQAVKSLGGLTAFSALPNAPVLPVKERRRFVTAFMSRLRGASAPRNPEMKGFESAALELEERDASVEWDELMGRGVAELEGVGGGRA